jgi:hypothetical protein
LLKIDARGKKVLIISDLHIPYSVRGYVRFLKHIKDTFNPDLVISIGDELDYHAMSFHDSVAELFSAGHELDRAIIELQEGVHKLFPKVYVLESNHGSMVLRRMKHHAIPIRVLRPLPELYETPEWSWHEEILLDTDKGPVYLCHGKSGTYGKMVKEAGGANCIQGHFHGKFEITYHRGVLGTRYNMFVGCLVDDESMAMAYGRNFTVKPILGSGGIEADGTPILFPYKESFTDETPPRAPIVIME